MRDIHPALLILAFLVGFLALLLAASRIGEFFATRSTPMHDGPRRIIYPQELRPVWWLLTQSDGTTSYYMQRPMSEIDALNYLRTHFANATLDHIDRCGPDEWSVIFYRIGRAHAPS
jgi:hypothetical protein